MLINIKPMGAVRLTQKSLWTPQARRYQAYKQELQLKLPGYELPPTIFVVFNIEMPKSWSKRKRAEMEDKPHQQVPDIDNLLKGVMDALAPAGTDGKRHDSYIYDARGVKYWAKESSIEIVGGYTNDRANSKEPIF